MTVHLFAALRDAAGAPQVELTLPVPCRVGELRAVLAREHPALATRLPHVMIAVNHDYARDEDLIPEHAQVALIPPVSGGDRSRDFTRNTE